MDRANAGAGEAVVIAFATPGADPFAPGPRIRRLAPLGGRQPPWRAVYGLSARRARRACWRSPPTRPTSPATAPTTRSCARRPGGSGRVRHVPGDRPRDGRVDLEAVGLRRRGAAEPRSARPVRGGARLRAGRSALLSERDQRAGAGVARRPVRRSCPTRSRVSSLDETSRTVAPPQSCREAAGTIRRMARIFVEGWDPDYGTPLDQDDALSPAEGSVDTDGRDRRLGADRGRRRRCRAHRVRRRRAPHRRPAHARRPVRRARRPDSWARSPSERSSGTGASVAPRSPTFASSGGRCSPAAAASRCRRSTSSRASARHGRRATTRTC